MFKSAHGFAPSLRAAHRSTLRTMATVTTNVSVTLSVTTVSASLAPASLPAGAASKPPLVDIACNLLDPQFLHGTYHGKVHHPGDLAAVLLRACSMPSATYGCAGR